MFPKEGRTLIINFAGRGLKVALPSDANVNSQGPTALPTRKTRTVLGGT